MYCPNCAAPIDGVKFCRSCGSNVSLVPQAMSGQLSQSEAPIGELHLGVHRRRRDRDRKKEPNVKEAVTELFIGMGFVIAAIAVLICVPSGKFWWWSFLIPAFALFGGGAGEYLRWREYQRNQNSLKGAENPAAYQSSFQAFSQAPAIPAPTTSEHVKPPSVTEHTTRHLE